MSSAFKEWIRRLTGVENSIRELLARQLAIPVQIQFAEEVHDSCLLVAHPANVALAPLIKVEVLQLLQLLGGNKMDKV